MKREKKVKSTLKEYNASTTIHKNTEPTVDVYVWTPFGNIESDYAHTCYMLHFHSLNFTSFFSLFVIVYQPIACEWRTNCLMNSLKCRWWCIFLVYWRILQCVFDYHWNERRHTVNKIWAILTSRCCYVKLNPLRSITFFGLLCLLTHIPCVMLLFFSSSAYKVFWHF